MIYRCEKCAFLDFAGLWGSSFSWFTLELTFFSSGNAVNAIKFLKVVFFFFFICFILFPLTLSGSSASSSLLVKP